MPNPPTDPRSAYLKELQHLLSLIQVEMSLLQDSASRMGQLLQMVPQIQFAREHLPWKRGKTVETDMSKLSTNLSRVVELIKLLEQDQPDKAT